MIGAIAVQKLSRCWGAIILRPPEFNGMGNVSAPALMVCRFAIEHFQVTLHSIDPVRDVMITLLRSIDNYGKTLYDTFIMRIGLHLDYDTFHCLLLSPLCVPLVRLSVSACRLQYLFPDMRWGLPHTERLVLESEKSDTVRREEKVLRQQAALQEAKVKVEESKLERAVSQEKLKLERTASELKQPPSMFEEQSSKPTKPTKRPCPACGEYCCS